MEQGPTIQDVILQITKLVAEVSVLSSVVSLGITQFVKQYTSKSGIIAAFAVIFGFLTGITLMKLFNGSFFSPMSILVGGIASLTAPGFFSVTKALKGSSQPIE